MAQPRVSRKSVDIVLKYTAEALGGALFERFGLPFAPIVDGLPSELPQLQIRSQQTDLLFRLADNSILHLEFQTTRRSGDLLRFAAYHLAVFERYRRPIHTVVLYGTGIRSAAHALETGALTFRVENVFVGRLDGDAVLQQLHEKAVRGETFSPVDRIDLILSPLMRLHRPVAEVARDAARLSVNVPQEQREMTVGALIGLAYPTISRDVVMAILEESGMMALSQAFLEEGELKGKREALRRILHKRFGGVPETVEQRIDTADSTQLDGLIDRAVIVESLNDL